MLLFVRNSWTNSRKENRGLIGEPAIVALAHASKDGGRLLGSRLSRGPQYVQDDEVLRLIGASGENEAGGFSS